ncbi:Regulatory protein RecX [Agromyces sp. NDB4Y10]|uniref:regulatory protein RecX n=1 Tax=Agromyces sp. NDB4Y10 TaxID=1775951 RepID=UPI0007B245A0|nr:regulatory protein RecX [Agromyces sp. NDB4Y10]KZE92650.1 Regulatory protein RecX [Agromyces sp. NDB4Y10]
MGEQRNEGLAPVTYLPWAVPSSGESDGGAAAPDRAAEAEERVEPAAARMSPRHPAGRGRSSRASNDESRPVERGGGRKARGLAVVGDAAPPETGIERDERIDRLIVSRLRRASLSIAEVRATLAEHGLDDHEIEEWIERYVRLGYLDDRRLAEQLVHSHGVRRGRGSGALLHELGRRGIDGELARSALETLDPDVELEHATLIAERRARQLAGLDPAVAHRRLTAFLLRRGYGSEVVREAVRAALDGDDAG